MNNPETTAFSSPETDEEEGTQEDQPNPIDTLEERGVPGGNVSSKGVAVETLETGFDQALIEKNKDETDSEGTEDPDEQLEEK